MSPALGALREFRERLLGCLTARGDALLDLADAVSRSGRPVRSLVQLALHRPPGERPPQHHRLTGTH
jgi:hypothetical protein